MVVIVVVVFMICWILLLYLCVVYVKSNVGVVYNWVRMLVLSNLVMNLWIYCFCMGEFCVVYEKLLRCGMGFFKCDISD